MIRRLYAYTLIQMMLVILVIAGISMAAINVTLTKEKTSKIKKTALQIAMIEQAALAYYVVNNKWPAKATDLYASGKFIDESVFCSPWTNTYNDILCGNFTPYELPISMSGTPLTYFSVSLEASSENLAKLIAGELPNSIVNGNKVISNVPLPGINPGSLAVPGLIIKDMFAVPYIQGHGDKPDGNFCLSKAVQPTCPQGWTPDYHVALVAYPSNQPADLPYVINYAGACKKVTKYGGNEWCVAVRSSFPPTTVGNNDQWKGILQVITYCRPQSVNFPGDTVSPADCFYE